MSFEPRHADAPAGRNLEQAVRERYSQGARVRVDALCCPVSYDTRFLEAIPREVIERDYGCGDPSRWVREGDVVLDLGSGGGKACFIAAQVVGPSGRVIGVDMNDDMLALARRAAPQVAERIGHANVTFRRGRIQDLRLDVDRLDGWLREHPVRGAADLPALQAAQDRLRRDEPMIPEESVDIVVSNCVLNLVREEDRAQLVREIYRVLRPGGRIAIADIVSDEVVPEELKRDEELWSGCVSGAFQEAALLRALEDVGFHGIAIAEWSPETFRVVDGIEFRSVTVTARKGKEGPCLEAMHAVIYRGPWRQVEDDDHHVLRRGERAAVCAKTYRILTSEPYARDVVPVPPRVEIPEEMQQPFDCARTTPRQPKETKGEGHAVTTAGSPCCGPSSASPSSACCPG
jgi:ubiquinone/menaquinone biosynthesis C-methylase UbiE